MNIAIYAIAKNEAQFAVRFAESCKEADLTFVLDTGSTDDTVNILRQHGVKVHELPPNSISPWRFDDARNLALALLPPDTNMCIKLDLDEVLEPGYREAITKACDRELRDFDGNHSGVTRLTYDYWWSEACRFRRDECHARKGYFWRSPVHEMLSWCDTDHKEVVTHAAFTIRHYPDKDKSRASYLKLLELAVTENPGSRQHLFWLGREYCLHNQREKAAETLHKFVKLKHGMYSIEVSAAMRLLSKIYAWDSEMGDAIYWAWEAVQYDPQSRENLWNLSGLQCKLGRQVEAMGTLSALLRIKSSEPNYLTEQEAWSDAPQTLYDSLSRDLAAGKIF